MGLKFMTWINLEVFRFLPTLKTLLLKKLYSPKKWDQILEMTNRPWNFVLRRKIWALVFCTPFGPLPHPISILGVRAARLCESVSLRIFFNFLLKSLDRSTNDSGVYHFHFDSKYFSWLSTAVKELLLSHFFLSKISFSHSCPRRSW